MPHNSTDSTDCTQDCSDFLAVFLLVPHDHILTLPESGRRSNNFGKAKDLALGVASNAVGDSAANCLPPASDGRNESFPLAGRLRRDCGADGAACRAYPL